MNGGDWIPAFWQALGVTAAVIFFGRFYLQWIVSEIKGRSVVPIGFWYMSSVGSLMLLAYGFYIQSPVGTLSHAFNIVVYSRNLVHIWRERQQLTPRRSVILHAAVAAIVLGAASLAALTWLREYHAMRGQPAEIVRQTWLWIAVGVAGQALFACRFLVQWVVSEARRKSVMPVAFWHLSIAASLLLTASHLQRAEWIFAAGLATTLLIYIRNLWLIRNARHAALLGDVAHEDPAAPSPPKG